jgi:preprotein translocase subunit SecG
MEYVLYTVHIIVCIAMLPIILLQSGKGGGVSAAFGGGGGAGTVFGSRGAGNFLTRMTTGAAIVFMCTSLALSWYSSRSRSVVGDLPAPPASSSGAGEAAPAGGAGDAPAATDTSTK